MQLIKALYSDTTLVERNDETFERAVYGALGLSTAND